MINKNNLNSCLILIFFLLPISFVIGPAVVELFFFILSISTILIYKNKIFNNHTKKFIIFFLLFYLYLNLNSFFAFDVQNSLRTSIPYIRFFIVIFGISYFMIKNKNIANTTKYILIIIFVILFLDSLYQFSFGKNIFGFPIVDKGTYRISSFFGSELILGGYVARILPILLSLIFFSNEINKNKNLNLWILLICFLSLVISALSGERVAFFQVIIITLFTIFFLIDSRKIKFFFISTLLILFVTLFSFDNKIKTRMFVNTLNTMKEVDKFANLNSEIIIFSQVHHSHILSGYKMFLDKPITGHGLKSFRKLCSDEKYRINNFSCTTHPHNFLIQFLSELGLLGTFFYIFAMLYFIINFFRDIFYLNKSYIKSKQCIAISILLFFLPIPTGSFFNNYMSYQFYYLIIFYIFYLYISKNFKEE